MTKLKIAQKLVVVGCGNMGGAIISGLCTSGSIDPSNILACDPNLSRLDSLKKEFNVKVDSDLQSALNGAEIILLAVKPNMASTVLKVASQVLIKQTNKPLLISVVTGLTTTEIKSFIGNEFRVVRVMPNLPCIIKAGVAGIYSNLVEENSLVRQIFSVLGETVMMSSEDDLYAVTGLSASGPAFVALVVEALTDGGVKMGLQRAKAQMLALHTLLGSARLLLEKEMHPVELKDMVATPGGTTICGLHQLEQDGVRASLISAVEKATLRAKELSNARERG